MKYLLLSLFVFVILDENDDLPEELRKFAEAGEKCLEASDNRALCFSKTSSLNIPNYQCCIVDVQLDDLRDINCTLFITNIEAFNEQQNSEIVKALLRELYGFIILRKDPGVNLKSISKYDCQNGQTEMKYGYEEYNSDDKEIIKSNKHCLRYFYSYLLEPNFKENFPTNNDCYNADLLQSTKDAGLKCGYGEFNLNFVSGKSEIYKTCYFYNSDIVKTKAFDDKSMEAFRTYASHVASTQGETLLNFKLEISDDNENKLSYDSLTNQVNVPSSSRRRSSSKVIKNYKCKYLLFLLILILL